MRAILFSLLALAFSGCATLQPEGPTVSILIDLDPASTDRTVIVESITADRSGLLYLPDRVTGHILRVDPSSPKAVVVGRIAARELQGRTVKAEPSGIAFDAQGDLFVAVGPFSEVVRIPKSELDPSGTLWVAANERNALVTVTPAGEVRQVARNGSRGPLEFPSAIVFVGEWGYVSNFDIPRRDNLDASGAAALDGIGASIARIQ